MNTFQYVVRTPNGKLHKENDCHALNTLQIENGDDAEFHSIPPWQLRQGESLQRLLTNFRGSAA
jgi:hypothetical protein